MTTERPRKPVSLEEIAETNPSKEEVGTLRRGYEELLFKQGSEKRIDPIGIGRLQLGGFKMLSFSTEVKVKDRNISLQVWRKKSKTPEREALYIHMGMRTGGGELVSLVLGEDGVAYWSYPDRSFIADGFSKENPTKKDLNLHAEVLKIATKQLSDKQQ